MEKMDRYTKTQQEAALLANSEIQSTPSEPDEEELELPVFRRRQRNSPMRPVYSILKSGFYFVAAISLLANIWAAIEWTKITKALEAYTQENVMPLNKGHPAYTYSPAEEALQYELKSINFKDHDDVYNGPPTQQTDRAWSDLLYNINLGFSADELRKANKQSIRVHLEEGETYIGYIEAYHQLHCLKRIMQNRWPEKYPGVAKAGGFTDHHFNHCMQVLRKGIMCKPDTTLNTWIWNPANRTDLKSITEPPRTCANWDRLHSWASSRAVGNDARKSLYSADEDGWFGPDR